jgi:hypothetical protein
MLFKSPIFSQASGSIGGTTFAHNRGGMYTRNRVIPTDPQTALQVAVRNAMKSLAAYWSSTLDAGQRAAWADYAANVAMTNRLGDQVFLTGQQHFLRSNVARVQAGLSIIEDGPTVYDLGTFTPPAISQVSVASDINIAFTEADAWVNADDAAMIVFTGRPVNPGVSFYKSPFRLAGTVLGNAMTPPSTPATITPAYTLVEGNNVSIKLRISQADGRLSAAMIYGPVEIDS